MIGGRRSPRRFAAYAVTLLVLSTGLLLGAAGFDVRSAFVALVRGSAGSWYALGSGTLVRATPLILTGLAVAVAFRAGVFNIGAEGQFLVGAAAGAAVALSMRSLPAIALIPAVLLAGVLAGAAWAWVAAVLRTRFHVLEVISTIMLNFIAAYLVSYLVRGPLQEPSHVNPQTETIVVAARLPRFGAATRLHLGFGIAIAACLGAWWAIRYTAAGFRLRVAGANAHAARSAGLIDVERVTTRAFLISGGVAGLAGAIEVSGVTYALYENISPGYGFTAIAVALLARLNPAAVIVTGILFGALEAGASAMQRDAGVPSVVVSVVEAGIILALVAVERARRASSTGVSE
ncbi:MAG: ABC-type transporter, integral rane subunit [Gemmatimonadetes bacterium]|nr:ABC-type transporter, integral rane subunit [Gemmatimonadota bacterium]